MTEAATESSSLADFSTDSARVWCVWTPKSQQGRTNLQFGIATSTWGLVNSPPEGSPLPNDFIVFGGNFGGGNVRTSASSWADQTSDVTFGQITSALYSASAPHWPDEVAAGTALYPHRFGFVPLGESTAVSLSAGGPLRAAADGLRRAAVSNAAILVTADAARIMGLCGVDTAMWSDVIVPDMSTVTLARPEAAGAARRSPGQGRTTDIELRDAVEKHAVDAAIAHMKSAHGWSDVQELGKPYDLVCRNPSGDEKHVEVKGTTGAGGSVQYTVNEVNHFRDCPHGADLVVVRDIRVDRSVSPYRTSGGELLHKQSYVAPRADPQAVRFEGRVEGWA